MGRVVNVSDESFGNGEFKPIPDGTKVLASVFGIEESTVKSGPNAGKDQLVVTFKVQGGEYNGREIRYVRLPLYAGNAAWKLVTFAEAVGWPSEKGKGVSVPDDVSSVLGKLLIVKVTEDPPRDKKVYNNAGGFAKYDPSAVDATATPGSGATTPSWGNLGTRS